METLTIPEVVIVDPKEKEVVLTDELAAAVPGPGATGIFQEADAAFASDPENYLRELEENVFSFEANGAKIDCSLIPGNSNKLLVVWAPFSDSAPRSSAEALYRYIQLDEPGMKDKAEGAPNSWNQLTKSAVTQEFLKAMGHDVSVLTIFSPLPSFPHNPYNHDDYKRIRRGDFSPAGTLAETAIRHAQERLHGLRSETRLDEFHAHGASLGASSALGMENVRSVTAQELIIAPKNVFGDLALRFLFRDPVGQPSEWSQTSHYRSLPEPLMRRQIDAHGNELAMVARMLQGMSKISRLKGLTRPHRNETPRLIERLAENGTSVMVPLAENSGPSQGTEDYLPDAGEKVVKIRATEGERTAHLVDEHVGLTALLAAVHVAQTAR